MEQLKIDKSLEEENTISLTKTVLLDSIYDVLSHPSYVTKTLVEFGHEPWPLQIGRRFWLFGPREYFAPNFLTYTNNLYQTYGFKALMWGLNGRLIANGITTIVDAAIQKPISTLFMERLPAEKGHICEVLNATPLTRFQHFRWFLSRLIQKTIVRSICLFVSYPFTTIAIRQIAQHIGIANPTVYTSVFDTLKLIVDEETPRGLYAGFVPALFSMCISIWGTSLIEYSVKRFYAQITTVELPKKLCYFILSLKLASDLVFIQPLAQAYRNTSRLMNITGTRLASTVMPIAPKFSHWTESYRYLQLQNGLYRGWLPFWRIHRGHVRVVGNLFYADYRHFLW
ncbi:hypothetical protein M3Y94_01110800 [Aphelenchoides besseyi]|nr:hypothetical protein M3Y94_01110800 [Aphelenchoides besseyi]KAI6221518.1 hypothetical protein M3Y95_00970300 [Aphelenchoides besseyi]